MFLGSILLVRSGEVSRALGSEVHELWGPPINQHPPTAKLQPLEEAERPGDATPAAAQPPPNPARAATPSAPSKHEQEKKSVHPAASKLRASRELEQRRKGLLWFPTYDVDFSGTYTFKNSKREARELVVSFPLERDHAACEGFEVLREGGEPVDTEVIDGVATWRGRIKAGQSRSYTVRFRSRGTTRWQYQPTAGTGRVDNFELAVATDFAAVDFPDGTLSPSTHEAAAGGWKGTWRFKSLVASTPIGLDLPQLLNPGPLAAKMTFFAPLSLLFYFFVVRFSQRPDAFTCIRCTTSSSAAPSSLSTCCSPTWWITSRYCRLLLWLRWSASPL